MRVPSSAALAVLALSAVACSTTELEPDYGYYPRELVLGPFRPGETAGVIGFVGVLNANRGSASIVGARVEGDGARYVRNVTPAATESGFEAVAIDSQQSERVTLGVAGAAVNPVETWQSGTYEATMTLRIEGGVPSADVPALWEEQIPVTVIVDCDADLDGVDAEACGGGDCDDLQDDVYEGAEEICDGIDNNCDFQIDEGC